MIRIFLRILFLDDFVVNTRHLEFFFSTLPAHIEKLADWALITSELLIGNFHLFSRMRSNTWKIFSFKSRGEKLKWQCLTGVWPKRKICFLYYPLPFPSILFPLPIFIDVMQWKKILFYLFYIRLANLADSCANLSRTYFRFCLAKMFRIRTMPRNRNINRNKNFRKRSSPLTDSSFWMDEYRVKNAFLWKPYEFLPLLPPSSSPSPFFLNPSN